MSKLNNKNFIAKQQTAFISAVGRRKESVARVRLYAGNIVIGDKTLKKGEMLVNGKPIKDYFSGDVSRAIYLKPFETTDTINKFVITIKVVGGGPAGQLDSVVHGVSRALEKYDKDKFRSLLKKAGLLTRDSRVRERRKVGTGGKARRKKQSPKR